MYEINFQTMEQTNTKTNNTTKLRRNTEQIPLTISSDEYTTVQSFFMKTILPGMLSIIKIERINNPNLLNPYLTKLQTMTQRYTENPHHRINNKIRPHTRANQHNNINTNNTVNDFERRWLFHGTQDKTVPKIMKQGFNRSFANPNCSIGNGIYFARDASYSLGYAHPDANSLCYMFLCRVAVGDWCKGRMSQRIPDTKPYDDNETFDSTVDNANDPSVFVTYHDCQAYPEYLISFKLRY